MEARLYLPKKMLWNGIDGSARDHVKTQFALHFGGYTEYEGGGGWLDDDRNLVEEPVWVVEVVGEHVAMRAFMAGLAEYVLRNSDQDAIMAVVDGEKIMAEA